MKIKHFISTFSLLVAFSYPVKGQQIINSFPSLGNESRGLAWDGEYLWCADAFTDSVYKLDPSNGTVVYSIPFSTGIGSNFGGLTWGDDNNIWIANGSYVYKINPANGQIISSFHCPGG